MTKEEYKKELIKCIELKDSKKINTLCNKLLQKNIELEEMSLSEKELNYVVKVCIETGFPNF